MNKKEWTVLLIEDDPMVQEVNRQFIEQVEGFTVIAAASNGLEGVQLIKQHQPDLTIIDMYMPSQDGLTTLQQIRANGYKTDVIAVTAASDIETVRKVLQYGAVDYIMKPFKFERMKQALEQYRSFQVKISQKEHITQSELDSMLFQQFEEKADLLPKGLNAVTLRRIQQYLSEQKHPISAEEVADGVGIARVTARRYLEFLEQENELKLSVEYGRVGRPINRYMLKIN